MIFQEHVFEEGEATNVTTVRHASFDGSQLTWSRHVVHDSLATRGRPEEPTDPKLTPVDRHGPVVIVRFPRQRALFCAGQ